MSMLEGKVAVVTGASSGIGRAISELFAEEGASVVINARGADALAGVARSIVAAGGRCAEVVGDVSDPETQQRLVGVAIDRFGGLDIAVNNAGYVGATGPLATLDPATWDRVVAVNLTAAFLGARAQIPALLARGGGSIIFVSSFVGTSVGIPGMGAYGAAKAGLMGLAKGITADYGAAGIRANALLAGGTDTPMAGGPEQKQWAAGLHALKRIADPREIAQAALFLASPMASFVAGSALYADGGNAAVK